MKTMKIIARILASMALPALVFGCAKPSATTVEGPGKITTDVSALTIPAEGKTEIVMVSSSHSWNCTADSWIQLSPTTRTGDITSVTVKVAANDGKENRTGKIVFTMPEKNLSAEVMVSQVPKMASTSVAEFKTKKVDETTWYTLRGTVTSIEGFKYGNFHLKDDTGEVFIYGMTSKQQNSNDFSFANLKLKEGDILTLKTLRSEYNGEARGGGNKIPAYYVAHEKGTEPAPPYRDFKANSAKAKWMELPATSENDGLVVLHHGMQIGSKAARGYTAYWDKANMVSSWVAYPLTRKLIGYGTRREDAWGLLDPLLDEDEQPKLNMAYKAGNDGGYTRGHQVPSADRTAYTVNGKTFYGTNMTPQNATFNEKIWNTLEEKVRTWAKSSATDTLYVVTGCITNGSTSYAYDNASKKVTVPVAYYKAILRLASGKYSACAFYLKHEANSTSDIKPYAMSVKALEEKTGINFFVNLDSSVAATVEAEDPTKNNWWWN